MSHFSGYNGANPNNNPICGKSVTAHCTFFLSQSPVEPLLTSPSFSDQGKSVTVKITDRCVGCAKWDLAFSPAAFSKLAAFELGRLDGVTWSFNN